jgi:hypothetical protein
MADGGFLGGIAQGIMQAKQNRQQKENLLQQMQLEREKMSQQQAQFDQTKQMQQQNLDLESDKFNQQKVEFEHKKKMDEVTSLYNKALTVETYKRMDMASLGQVNKMLASVKYSNDPQTAYEQILVPYIMSNEQLDPNIKKMFPEKYDKKAEALVTWAMGMTGDALDLHKVNASQQNSKAMQVKLPEGYQWSDPNNPEAGMKPIPGGPANKMSGEAAKFYGVAQIGKTALKDLNEYTTNENFVQSAVLPNFAQTKEAQMLSTKLGQLDEAVGRLHSGGAITDGDVDRFRMLYPKIGDKPEVIKYKMEALNHEFESMTSNMKPSAESTKSENKNVEKVTIKEIMEDAQKAGFPVDKAMAHALKRQKEGKIEIIEE